MINKKLVFILIISACLLKSLHAAMQTKRQTLHGSTVPHAGSPQLPTFTLTESQSASLPPIDPEVYRDSLLPTAILAYKHGYASQVHRVVTPDEYILEVHRIISSPYREYSPRKPVVFLQHGFLDSSATWVMSGQNHGLAYALADAGYDVWMGNARGNVYSRKHVRYDPDGSREDREHFWRFSWHEIGVIDLPAMLDYVLNTTRQEQLFYIGHSQGTTSFFVMLSQRPEYNEKIKMMHALAPVAYMDNAVSPILKFAELLPAAFRGLTELLGAFELLPSMDFFKLLGQQLCGDKSPIFSVCESVLFLITGFNERNLNATLFPVFLSHTPAGAATYQLVHFVQEARSGRFCQFDWGSEEENMARYGRPTPPAYNMKNVLTRVILHYSDNDWLSSPIDVRRLYAKLPNAEMNHIPDERFEHMDFVWGIEARKVLYEPIIASMKLYDRLVAG